MENRKFIRKIIIICTIVMISCVIRMVSVDAAAMKPDTPQNLVVQRYENRALKLKWKKVSSADGYRIYRYNKKLRKFIKVKTVDDKNKLSWINRDLKFHKVYEYKISAFKKTKGKKVFSKRSYVVSARTYASHAIKVNVWVVSTTEGNQYEMGVYGKKKLQPLIYPDQYTKRRKARTISKKVHWYSSDNTMVRVNQGGGITSLGKEGSCYIYLRAHNGVTGKIKVTVKNYAQPDSFPYYDGRSKYTTELLVNYKKEICGIATYFTKYGAKVGSGVITTDEQGNINGMEGLTNYTEIEKEVKRLLTEFPLVTEIHYSENLVSFVMKFDVYGNSYIEVTYSAKNDYLDSPLCIAPHWKKKQFSPM